MSASLTPHIDAGHQLVADGTLVGNHLTPLGGPVVARAQTFVDDQSVATTTGEPHVGGPRRHLLNALYVADVYHLKLT